MRSTNIFSLTFNSLTDILFISADLSEQLAGA